MIRVTLTGTCIACIVCTSTSSGASFQTLGTGTGVGGISADGTIVVGSSNNAAFRWTQGTGLVPLAGLYGADAVSTDGSVIAGGTNQSEGAIWNSAGVIPLGVLSPGTVSPATAISGDGSVVVGFGVNSAQYTEAYRWTAATGIVGLGYLPGGVPSSMANGISADGTVIVGQSESSQLEQAFRWTQATGMVGLGVIPGSNYGESSANAISADGTTIVGYDAGTSPTFEAFRWTQTGGMVGLGQVPGGAYSLALAVSGDGAVIVGDTDLGPFIWDSIHGMRLLQNVLQQDYGLNLNGFTLRQPDAISANGHTIIGTGIDSAGHSEAWIAQLPEPQSGLLALLAVAIVVARLRLNQSFSARQKPIA
jgi:probable HAF family extracellular repeat protein